MVAFVRSADDRRVHFDNFRLFTGEPGAPGDVNNDGMVDAEDYFIIRDNFRTNTINRNDGDLNLDGTVDYLDYVEWRENASPAALKQLGFAIPELLF